MEELTAVLIEKEKKEKRVGGAEGRKRGRLGFASARMGFKRGGRSR
jgi:hypothetical protein